MLIDRVRAADFNFISQPGANDTNTNADLTTLVSNVVNILLFIAGALAIIYLIYSGILYITAAGNPDAAKKGQQGVLNAVIGLVIIVLAFFIARAVTNYANSVGGAGSV
jgi:glucan phosphoethanolaminetransferase (alkaline phosphatase superfamily)